MIGFIDEMFYMLGVIVSFTYLFNVICVLTIGSDMPVLPGVDSIAEWVTQ